MIAKLTSDEGKADLKSLGGVSAQTAGVILRALVNLEAEGADTFFGEPELEPKDLLRFDDKGRGVISLLELGDQAARPVLFSTFLMWVLSDLFTDAARDRRRRQAQAGVLLRRGAPAVHRSVQGVSGTGRADRQADPLARRRSVLLHSAAHRRAQRGALAVGCAHPARAARVHSRRSEGADENRPHLPENRCVRPCFGVDVTGHRRSGRHRALRTRRPDSGRLDQAAFATVADGRHRRRCDRRRRQGQPPAGDLRRDQRP